MNENTLKNIIIDFWFNKYGKFNNWKIKNRTRGEIEELTKLINTTIKETESLMKEIEKLIEILDKDNILSQLTRDKINIALTRFVEKSILKFIVGQKEHGGNLEDRNLDEEIYNEILDLHWYLTAKEWRP